MTTAPCAAAISAERSVEPLSTTITSPVRPLASIPCRASSTTAPPAPSSFRPGVVREPARHADERVAPRCDEPLDRGGDLRRIGDVLEDVAAHHRAELQHVEAREEPRVGQVPRDVDARRRLELVVEDSNAAS